MRHLDLFMGLNEDKVKEICFTKLDIALDLSGAFIPPDDGPVYSLIQKKLQNLVKKIFI